MNQGFAMLLSVLILAAIGMFISTTLLILSVSAAQTTGSLQESQQARALASACVEKGLQQLITLNTYTGSGSQTLGLGTCTYTVSTIDPYNDSVVGVGTVGQTTRRAKAIIYISQLLVTSWQEI